MDPTPRYRHKSPFPLPVSRSRLQWDHTELGRSTDIHNIDLCPGHHPSLLASKIILDPKMVHLLHNNNRTRLGGRILWERWMRPSIKEEELG